MSTKRLVTDAVLIAMYAVMATFLTLNLGGMNISVGALPIIVGAALFGPVEIEARTRAKRAETGGRTTGQD